MLINDIQPCKSIYYIIFLTILKKGDKYYKKFILLIQNNL